MLASLLALLPVPLKGKKKYRENLQNSVIVTNLLYLFIFCNKEFQSFCIVKDYSSSIGNNLTIDCPLSGFPPPIVTWKKNGTLLQKGGSTKLTITSVKEGDFGIYTCTATNFEISAGPCNISVVKETGMYKENTM